MGYSVKNSVLWDGMICNSVDIYEIFMGTNSAIIKDEKSLFQFQKKKKKKLSMSTCRHRHTYVF